MCFSDIPAKRLERNIKNAMLVTITVFLSSLTTLVASQESEEERLGFFPDVPEVECECAINVQLKGDERQMTWTDSSSK